MLIYFITRPWGLKERGAREPGEGEKMRWVFLLSWKKEKRPENPVPSSWIQWSVRLDESLAYMSRDSFLDGKCVHFRSILSLNSEMGV